MWVNLSGSVEPKQPEEPWQRQNKRIPAGEVGEPPEEDHAWKPLLRVDMVAFPLRPSDPPPPAEQNPPLCDKQHSRGSADPSLHRVDQGSVLQGRGPSEHFCPSFLSV